jgi:hypothetical protein
VLAALKNWPLHPGGGGCQEIEKWLDQRCASFEASLREAPQDEDGSLMPSMIYLMLRSARRARLEARTALLQLIFSALIDFLTASEAGIYRAPNLSI